jgi:hypothetical protein
MRGQSDQLLKDIGWMQARQTLRAASKLSSVDADGFHDQSAGDSFVELAEDEASTSQKPSEEVARHSSKMHGTDKLSQATAQSEGDFEYDDWDDLFHPESAVSPGVAAMSAVSSGLDRIAHPDARWGVVFFPINCGACKVHVVFVTLPPLTRLSASEISMVEVAANTELGADAELSLGTALTHHQAAALGDRAIGMINNSATVHFNDGMPVISYDIAPPMSNGGFVSPNIPPTNTSADTLLAEIDRYRMLNLSQLHVATRDAAHAAVHHEIRRASRKKGRVDAVSLLETAARTQHAVGRRRHVVRKLRKRALKLQIARVEAKRERSMSLMFLEAHSKVCMSLWYF